MAAPRRSSSVHRGAAALYDAATAFIRFYQFRDRDQALRLGLTVVQAYALDTLLAAGGPRLAGLADALQVDKSTTSLIVAGMKRRALVEWLRAEHDLGGTRYAAPAVGRRCFHALRGGKAGADPR